MDARTTPHVSQRNVRDIHNSLHYGDDGLRAPDPASTRMAGTGPSNQARCPTHLGIGASQPAMSAGFRPFTNPPKL